LEPEERLSILRSVPTSWTLGLGFHSQRNRRRSSSCRRNHRIRHNRYFGRSYRSLKQLDRSNYDRG
jgi:hypothetical protein